MLNSIDPVRSRIFANASHVRQHARHALLRHLVRRVARPGDRLRGRRLPAGPGAGGRRHPARARPAQARHVAPRHAAARERHRRDPFRRVRRPHHRHADRAADPQRGPAQQGLREHRRHVPARARRLHVLAEIRHPRLSRRRPRVGARDRGARRRRRDRKKVARRAPRRRDPRPSGRSSGRCAIPFEDWDRGRRESVLRRQCDARARARGVHGPAAQGRRFLRRADHGGRERRAGGLGRAGLRPARCRSRRRDDEHQRGEGRGDRRGLRAASRSAAPSTPTR